MLLAAATLALGGACSPDGPGAPASPLPTVTGTTQSPTVGDIGSMDCLDSALLQAPGEALTVFPDNPDVVWTARPADIALGDLILAELTPEPDVVGYPEFRFVYRCDAGRPAMIATYALEEARFVLLSTSDALGDEQLPAELEWVPPESVD